MQKFRMLILTDHTNHTSENSLYDLAKALNRHPFANQVDLASRGVLENSNFFSGKLTDTIFVNPVTESFVFDKAGKYFKEGFREKPISIYDVVLLRLPPPLGKKLLDIFNVAFKHQLVINAPKAIYETGSKEFLTNFVDICPPLKVCRSIEDIIEFKNRFPIVLKPFREYGGKGIVRIENDKVWYNETTSSFSSFLQKLDPDKIEYLGVKFLKNVSLGDKRIVVVNGEVIGASLRLPKEGSWICNAAQGGKSKLTEVEEEELKIVAEVNAILSNKGIGIYGLDTLVADNGKRVLSELNTTSIGGIVQIAKLRNLPLVEKTADLIWKYFIENR